jgi:hypothetical protein
MNVIVNRAAVRIPAPGNAGFMCQYVCQWPRGLDRPSIGPGEDRFGGLVFRLGDRWFGQVRQRLNRLGDGQGRWVGVDVHGQPHVGVPHDFHRRPRRDASLGHHRCQGHPQGVKIDAAILRVQFGYPGFRQIDPEQVDARHAREHRLAILVLVGWARRAQLLGHVLPQVHPIRSTGLGRLAAKLDVRLGRVQPKVVPAQVRNLRPPQACHRRE